MKKFRTVHNIHFNIIGIRMAESNLKVLLLLVRINLSLIGNYTLPVTLAKIPHCSNSGANLSRKKRGAFTVRTLTSLQFTVAINSTPFLHLNLSKTIKILYLNKLDEFISFIINFV